MMEASMIRAANKTIMDFDWMRITLASKARESSCPVSAFVNMIPPGAAIYIIQAGLRT